MIFSERLFYKVPEESDFERYFEIHSDPQTNLFNPAGPMDYEKAVEGFKKFKQHWGDHGFGSWTIIEKNSGQIIGFGGLSKRMYGDEEKVNLGYRLGTDSWGKGYATEISNFAIKYGFEELKFTNIFAVVRPAHTASINVLEKCGLKYFGTLDDVPGKEESLVYFISA